MTTRWNRGAPRALATLTLLALLFAAPYARAADPDTLDGGDEGAQKVIAYARCAFLVFIAVTPGGIFAAFMDCSRTFLSEPPLTSGGLS